MRIPISSNYEIEHKNGYFVFHKLAISGEESQNPGEKYTVKASTYAKMLDAWYALKQLGQDSTKVLAGFEKLIVETQKQAGRQVLADRNRALNLSITKSQ